MEKKKIKSIGIISLTLAVCLAIIIIALSYALKCKKNNPEKWVLKAQENTVVLLNNGEVVEVFSSIVLDTLPKEDITHLENGISFLTKQEALTAVEDYDG